jgi:hypothetical protein
VESGERRSRSPAKCSALGGREFEFADIVRGFRELTTGTDRGLRVLDEIERLLGRRVRLSKAAAAAWRRYPIC